MEPTNISNTPNIMQIQFTIHSRLHLLGWQIANHMQHGKKYVVGAYANPPKKPKSPLKNGKVIAITIVKPGKFD
jgi:hypothetical protein